MTDALQCEPPAAAVVSAACCQTSIACRPTALTLTRDEGRRLSRSLHVHSSPALLVLGCQGEPSALLHHPLDTLQGWKRLTRLCNRHLAAAEGCFSVVEWLLKEAGADPNPIDRFNRTPLEARRVLHAVPHLEAGQNVTLCGVLSDHRWCLLGWRTGLARRTLVRFCRTTCTGLER